MSLLHKLRSRRWLFVALVLPGFVLRALIPPGFMPASSGGTPFAMQMCPGHASMPMPGQDSGGPAGKHHEAPCAFAAAAGLAPTPFVACLAAWGPASVERLAALVQPAPARPLHRAHPPRAPPTPV